MILISKDRDLFFLSWSFWWSRSHGWSLKLISIFGTDLEITVKITFHSTLIFHVQGYLKMVRNHLRSFKRWLRHHFITCEPLCRLQNFRALRDRFSHTVLRECSYQCPNHQIAHMRQHFIAPWLIEILNSASSLLVEIFLDDTGSAWQTSHLKPSFYWREIRNSGVNMNAVHLRIKLHVIENHYLRIRHEEKEHGS